MNEKHAQDTAKMQGRGKVGRNKPPQWCQWKTGTSGNPAGKRPGAISLEAALRKSIRANPSKARDVINAVIERAIAGDMESAKLIFDLS